MRPDLFKSALKEYSVARKSNVVRAYIDALTKGGYICNKLCFCCSIKKKNYF